MFHQCLKCGRVYPRGSDVILNGCSDCGGKKFFLISEPAPQAERDMLAVRTDRAVQALIPELFAHREKFETVNERGEPEPDGGEWVKVSPEDVDLVLEPEGAPGEAGSGDAGPAGSGGATDSDEDFDTTIDLPTSAPAPKAAKRRKVRALRSAPKREGPAGQGPRPARTSGKTPPASKGAAGRPRKGPGRSGGGVDVVTVVEPGVYEIDLERLLNKSPIIIQKDGTYLIHLPSAMRK